MRGPWAESKRVASLPQMPPRPAPLQKIATILFLPFPGNRSATKRRVRDADRNNDLRWFDGRAGPSDIARAGETFRRRPSRRQTGGIAVHGVPAGRRWIMEAAAMRGRRFRKPALAQIRGTNDRRTYAMRPPPSLRGAKRPKQSTPPLAVSWIASLTLAMTFVIRDAPLDLARTRNP